jgi:hypothetical protein
VGWDSSQLAGNVGGRAERSLHMLRRPWWVWGFAGAALIIAMFGWFSAEFPRDPLPTVGAWLTLAVVLAAGVIAAGSPNQRANGRLMLLIGLALSTNYLFFNPHGFFVSVAYVLAPFADLLLYVLLLRWPRSRLQTRSQLWLVRVALVGIPPCGRLSLLPWLPSSLP